jgi:hypothetical protein
LPSENKSPSSTDRAAKQSISSANPGKNILALRQKFLFSRLFMRKRRRAEFLRGSCFNRDDDILNYLKEKTAMRMKSLETIFGLLLVALAGLGTACSFGSISAQKTAPKETVTRPTESPTPGYKPLKRVSRDIVASDKMEEAPKDKVKK